MAEQAVSSVLQLSTFAKVTSIPSSKNHPDFPLTVGVKAPKMTVHQHAPVDVVAVLHASDKDSQHRLALVKKAMAKVMKNLAGGKNRLALLAYSQDVQKTTRLLDMTDGAQERRLSDTIESLYTVGRTQFLSASTLFKAVEILDNRWDAAKEKRLGFIIFVSDGDDKFYFETDNIPRSYPIHAVGFSARHNAEMLKAMGDLTSGSYTAINQDLDKITEVLDQLSDKLASIVAVDTRIDLKPAHPGVTLSRIESSANDGAGDSYSSHISDDKRSGEIFAGVVSSGKGREFTVYLDVPEGQGSGADGAMDLLTVSGVYTQSWDQKQVALGESVVAVARPATAPPPKSNVDDKSKEPESVVPVVVPPATTPPPPLPPPKDDRCKELDWIEERLKYWCKAKQDLSAMYDKAETEANKGGDGDAAENKCECQVTEALREASLEIINKAMHHDIYTAVLHALKLRQCRTGGSKAAVAKEDAPSSAA